MAEPSTDRFQEEHMAGGEVLLRDKVVGRKAQWLLLIPMLWCLAGAIASFAHLLPGSGLGVGAALIALTAFFAFLWATLTVVRTVVTAREVHVQYGLWGPRVPVERIKSCRVVPYDWKAYGGFGIKASSEDGSWAYVIGASGDVVELVFTGDSGEEKVLFSASDPQAVAIAVQRARARRVDVADEELRIDAGAHAADEAAGEEAAAEEEAAAKKARPRRG